MPGGVSMPSDWFANRIKTINLVFSSPSLKQISPLCKTFINWRICPFEKGIGFNELILGHSTVLAFFSPFTGNGRAV